MIELRKLNQNDYANFYKYVIDEEIMKEFSFNYNEESCKERLNTIIERYSKSDKVYIWAVTLDDKLIGVVSIDSVSNVDKSCSIGYGISKEYRGNGYAYHAVLKVLDYIFNTLDMHRVEITCNIYNEASRKTIEKLGARFEGIAREAGFYENKFIDRRVYSILKQDFSTHT